MRFFALILSLSAAASAADIRMRFETNCNGGYLEYKNIAQKTCASGIRGNQGSPSVGFRNMPHNVAVYGWQATRGAPTDCGTAVSSGNTGGSDNACLHPPSGLTFSGGSWQRNGKRDVFNTDDQACTQSQKPDTLVLADGTKYELKGMEEELVVELYDLAVNGTGQGGIPEVFAAFGVVE